MVIWGVQQDLSGSCLRTKDDLGDDDRSPGGDDKSLAVVKSMSQGEVLGLR